MKDFLIVGTDNVGKIVSAETEADAIAQNTATDDVFQIRELTQEESLLFNNVGTIPAFAPEKVEAPPVEEKKVEVKTDVVEEKKVEEKKIKIEIKEIDVPTKENELRRHVRGEVNEHIEILMKNLVAIDLAINVGSALPNNVVKNLLIAIKNGTSELNQAITHWNNIR